MGTFLINKRNDGDFQFNLKAGNGQIILTSEGYTSRAACDNGIESVRKNSTDDSKYERKASANDKPYFTLKAANGQVIGRSEMYESTASMENGIESVKKNAPDADIKEDLGN